MRLRNERKSLFGRFSILLGFVLITHTLPLATADHGAFNYPPIEGDILSAAFSVDFAALTAHRTIFGEQVNAAMLLDLTTGLPPLDLSDDLFGTASWPDPPRVDMGPLETGIISAGIDPLFFPALESGDVGLWALFTDTDDALFAIDTIFLTIETDTGIIESHYGSDNDGFGIGIPDFGDLPAPLPDSIPIGATGTGFDESITSKSIHIPEPASVVLLAGGVLILLHRRVIHGNLA